MSKSSTNPSRIKTAPAPGEWLNLLRRSGVRMPEFMAAFATLGVLSMLDERDAAESAERKVANGFVPAMPLGLWKAAWLANGIHGLQEWLGRYAAVVCDNWPFRRTANIRAEFWQQDALNQSALALAAALFCSEEAQATTAQAWFAGEWQEILWELQHQRLYNREELTWAMQELIALNVRCTRGQSVLVMMGAQNILLWQLLKEIESAHRQEPVGSNVQFPVGQADLAEIPQVTSYGKVPTKGQFPVEHFDVVTHQRPTVMLSWATLLAFGVESPQVRLAAFNYSKPSAGYDWVIAIPSMGVSQQSVEQNVPAPVRRLEYICLQQAYRTLRPGGRLVALMPRRLGISEDKESLSVRQWLLEETRLVAVMEIPSKAAYEGAGIGTYLLLIQHDLPANRLFFLSEILVKVLVDERDETPKPSGFRVVANALSLLWGLPDADTATLDLVRIRPEWLQLRDAITQGRIADAEHSLVGKLRSGWIDLQTLASRRYELSYRDEDFTGDLVARHLNELARNDPRLHVCKLGDVAEVFSGASFRSEGTLPRKLVPEDERSRFPLIIRVGDLPRSKGSHYELPEVKSPTICVRPEHIGRLSGRHFLQPWDILVSRAGTVGKVAVYQPEEDETGGSVPAIASNQIFVVRPRVPFEKKTSRHLIGILVSDAGQEWLNSRVTGSAIAHLRIDDLRQLPVIDANEDFVLNRIGEHLISGHPLETSGSVLHDKTHTDQSILFFSENQSVRDYVSPSRGKRQTDRRLLLESLHGALMEFGGDNGGEFLKGRYHNWWKQIENAVSGLLAATRNGDGRDQVTQLQFWLRSFKEEAETLRKPLVPSELDHVDSTAPETDSLVMGAASHFGIGLLERLEEDANRWLNAICNDVRLMAELSPSCIAVAKETVIHLRLTNQSPLSLTRVHASIRGFQGKCDSLSPASTLELPFVFEAIHSGLHPILVNWTATRLDGKSVEGSMELNLEATSLREKAAVLEFNPYVDGGSPVGQDGKMFFGREDALHRIDLALARENRSTVLIVEGNRRIGKSSLLLYYRTKRLDTTKWLPVYINFQDFGGAKRMERGKLTGIPDVRIFQGMARELIKAASSAGIAVKIAGVGEFAAGLTDEVRMKILEDVERFFREGDPFERFRHILDIILPAVAPKRLLLMFDEFDRIQAGIDSGVTSDQVPENFRHLLQSYPQLAAILTGSLKIRRLRQQYWHVLFNLGQSLQLRGLDEDSARQLVIEPVRGAVTYVPDAVDEILRITGHQPLLVQVLCGRLFDLCQDSKANLVTLEMVQEAAQEQVEDSENFATLWDFIDTPRQKCLALLLEQLTRDSERATPILLRDEAEDKGIRFGSLQEFTSDLDALKDLDVIGFTVKDQTEFLRFEVPLFALWLRRHQDFAVQCAALAEAGD